LLACSDSAVAALGEKRFIPSLLVHFLTVIKTLVSILASVIGVDKRVLEVKVLAAIEDPFMLKF
jgi:hypothetical protein